jgi:hypothetical protein
VGGGSPDRDHTQGHTFNKLLGAGDDVGPFFLFTSTNICGMWIDQGCRKLHKGIGMEQFHEAPPWLVPSKIFGKCEFSILSEMSLSYFLLNILVLPNNNDKDCYLQFNVTRKIENFANVSSQLTPFRPSAKEMNDDLKFA